MRHDVLRLGTRPSVLAQWQARWVAKALEAFGVIVELTPLATRGDADQTPIGAVHGQGIFTKEIQRALLDGRVDLAVHSLKDLPTAPVEGLWLAAVPARGPVADVLVSRGDGPAELTELPDGSVIGTGSPRRRAQLLHVCPGLQMADIRGNVDTRLRKLDAGQYDAIVLAQAGLTRLGFDALPGQRLPVEIMLPAVGQGALGVECRADDQPAADCLKRLDHLPSRQAVMAERAMLSALEGGCLAPVAAWARLENDAIVLSGRVLSLDGRRRLDATGLAPPTDCQALGRRVAEKLLAQGAADLIAACRP